MRASSRRGSGRCAISSSGKAKSYSSTSPLIAAPSKELPPRAKASRMSDDMDEFSQALESALITLGSIQRESTRPPRASRAALALLRAATPLVRGKEARLAPLRERVAVCRQCPHLASSRTQTVFGVGNVDAELMFI